MAVLDKSNIMDIYIEVVKKRPEAEELHIDLAIYNFNDYYEAKWFLFLPYDKPRPRSAMCNDFKNFLMVMSKFIYRFIQPWKPLFNFPMHYKLTVENTKIIEYCEANSIPTKIDKEILLVQPPNADALFKFLVTPSIDHARAISAYAGNWVHESSFISSVTELKGRNYNWLFTHFNEISHYFLFWLERPSIEIYCLSFDMNIVKKIIMEEFSLLNIPINLIEGNVTMAHRRIRKKGTEGRH